MKTFFLTSLIALLTVAASAQELQFPSGKDKHDAKPSRFNALEQSRRYNSEVSSLHNMMSFTVNQKISVTVGTGYTFRGVVIEKKMETPELLTIVARSSEDPTLLFTISRVMIGGQPSFRGAIIGKVSNDLVMLEPDEQGNYAWNVRKVSQMLAD